MSNWLLIKEILGLFRLHWFWFLIFTSIHFYSLHFSVEISHILHIPFIKILNQLLLSLEPLCDYSGTYTTPEFYFLLVICHILSHSLHICTFLLNSVYCRHHVPSNLNYDTNKIYRDLFPRQFIPEESALPSWDLILDFLKIVFE